MPFRHRSVSGRRGRQAASGSGLGARLFHLGAARLWRCRGAFPSRALRPRAISQPVAVAQRLDNPSRAVCLGGERGPRRHARFRCRWAHRDPSDQERLALHLGSLESFLCRSLRADWPLSPPISPSHFSSFSLLLSRPSAPPPLLFLSPSSSLPSRPSPPPLLF